ncbi:MAG: pyridoxal-phosphate dependent enzyme [Polyangiaceae bacterium]|nr:pyridoxal-phosphate dependent enzyme [Polyangiaceae bacterium]
MSLAPPRVPALFRRLPELATLPMVPLAHVPTPVERAPSLSAPGVDVWMKRDDLVSPLYGGNKVRRYEYVLADVIARGSPRIVTAGGLASTQVTATALFARLLSLELSAVLFDQPVTRFAKEAVLADADAGARLFYGGGYARTAARTWLLQRRPDRYLILPGAPTPLANIGYVDAMLELAEQVDLGLLPRPDHIVLPTGSSGTLAALALGAAWLGWETEIIGVRITDAVACNRLTVGLVIDATRRWLEARSPTYRRARRRAPRFSLHGGALGPGYGHPTPEARRAIDEVRALTGAPGEVTYSGKALVGLRQLLAERRAQGTVLLWNTLSVARPIASPGARAKVPRELSWVLDAPEVA